MKKRIFIILITTTLLSACSEVPNSIKDLRKDDILRYGISYEADRLLKLGIEAITIDNDGTITFMYKM
ncbi:hypothetical protein R4Z10_07665 [Niallia sp. XMNu-256]|uniref:hypothetical protein n=1 Tax=Niallia sp. XMNu-256 TaxID=3082444 RepID=UPI0030CE6E45